MVKFRKKLVVVEAVQWFKNGDHPEDNMDTFIGPDGDLIEEEGDVVQYYYPPQLPLIPDSLRKCEHCGAVMKNHGWIDTAEGGRIVCPGDWIITGVQGERYLFKNLGDPTLTAEQEK